MWRPCFATFREPRSYVSTKQILEFSLTEFNLRHFQRFFGGGFITPSQHRLQSGFGEYRMASDNVYFLHRSVRPHHCLQSKRHPSGPSGGQSQDTEESAAHLPRPRVSTLRGRRCGVAFGCRRRVRAETNAGMLQRGRVHFKIDPSTYESEINHAALVQEIAIFADQQHAALIQSTNERPGLSFRTANEKATWQNFNSSGEWAWRISTG